MWHKTNELSKYGNCLWYLIIQYFWGHLAGNHSQYCISLGLQVLKNIQNGDLKIIIWGLATVLFNKNRFECNKIILIRETIGGKIGTPKISSCQTKQETVFCLSTQELSLTWWSIFCVQKSQKTGLPSELKIIC